MNSKLSVIVPIYKVERYLRQCLDSIICQTYQNLEIILIDDGSPDQCGIICDEYAKKDSRVVVVHKENEGLSAARNDGLYKATGEWVTFVDSDDWLDLDYYENLFRDIQNQQAQGADVFCSGGFIREINGKQYTLYTLETSFYEKNTQKEYYMAKAVVKEAIANGATWSLPWDKLYKKEFLDANNLIFDISSRGWEDAWFNFQVFDFAKRVGGSTSIGYHYRLNPTSIANNYNGEKPAIAYDYISKLHSYVEAGKYRKDILQQAIYAATIGTFSVCCRSCYFNPNNPNAYKSVANDIKRMKEKPYFKAALKEKSNQFLTKKQIILKKVLRMPCIWPLKFGFVLRERLLYRP